MPTFWLKWLACHFSPRKDGSRSPIAASRVRLADEPPLDLRGVEAGVRPARPAAGLAAGQCYLMASMAPELRAEVARLVEGLVDGHPAFMVALSPVRVAPAPKPCPAG